jgi:hypothetical protein
VTDAQVRKLMEEMSKHGRISDAAMKAGMHRQTARKYVEAGELPSTMAAPRDWRTRTDLFEEHWPEIEARLRATPELEAKTVFELLQEQHPDRYEEGQLRTLQRRVKQWRAAQGPEREVVFAKAGRPAEPDARLAPCGDIGADALAGEAAVAAVDQDMEAHIGDLRLGGEFGESVFVHIGGGVKEIDRLSIRPIMLLSPCGHILHLPDEGRDADAAADPDLMPVVIESEAAIRPFERDRLTNAQRGAQAVGVVAQFLDHDNQIRSSASSSLFAHSGDDSSSYRQDAR